MPVMTKIGPCTAIVEPGRPAEGDKPGVSATYRNIAAVDELPTSVSYFSFLILLHPFAPMYRHLSNYYNFILGAVGRCYHSLSFL